MALTPEQEQYLEKLLAAKQQWSEFWKKVGTRGTYAIGGAVVGGLIVAFLMGYFS